MADIRMNNAALEGDLDDLNRQARNMNEAITTFTALVQANLQNFTGLTPEQLTDRTNALNARSSSMNNTFSNAGHALARMIEAINNGDRAGAGIISGG